MSNRSIELEAKLRLALEFVEANHSGGSDAFELITAIKEALMSQSDGAQRTATEGEDSKAWVGLTDEEMRLIDPDGFEDNLPQMIQQALKEKSTRNGGCL